MRAANLLAVFLSFFNYLLVIFSVFLPSLAYAEINEIDREAALRLIVMIEGQFDEAGYEKTLGGGIIFGRDDEHVYIATANHVVRKGERQVQRLQVKFRETPKKAVHAELLEKFDQQLDLGVLRVKRGKPQQKGNFGCIPFDRLADPEGLKREVRVYPVGYPNGIPWAMPVLPDAVAQLTGDEFAFQSAFVGPGHSGGAVINETGELLGLILKDQPPFGSAMMIGVALKKLQNWGIPIRLRISTYGRDNAILKAIRDADIVEVKQLIEECHDMNESDKWNETPLRRAIQSGRFDLATLLLDHGADVNWEVGCGTPLHAAMDQKNDEMIKLLLSRGAAVMKVSRRCELTALSRAIKRKHEEWIKRFIKSKNWDLSKENSLLEAELLRAVQARPEWSKGVELLLQAGANVNAHTKKGDSNLHMASERGYVNTVKVLLSHGVEIRDRNSNGETALDVAMRNMSKGKNLIAPSDLKKETGDTKDFIGVVNLLLTAGAKRSSMIHN